MKRLKTTLLIGAALCATSALFFCLHYLIFHDLHHIFIYLLHDVAFVPIEVFLVVVVLEQLLSSHEKRQKLQKLNMIIGMFFTEVGTELLGQLTGAVRNKQALEPHLNVGSDGSTADFKAAERAVADFDYEFDAQRIDLPQTHQLLKVKRPLLLTLLANPNLLEHERFTDLLWAVFHLLEELEARPSLGDLPESDRRHLAGDVARAYSLLTLEWLNYCEHLKSAYPYIFSILVRTHPLQEEPSAVVTA
jgi:hypothetical protein